MDAKTRFFDSLFIAVSELVRDANGDGGLDISRYGARGLYFSVKRKDPVRKIEVNFQGPASFVHLGPAGIPVEAVDTKVAIRHTDGITLTVDQWADSIMQYLMKPEPAKAAAAASAGKAAAKPTEKPTEKPVAKKPGKK